MVFPNRFRWVIPAGIGIFFMTGPGCVHNYGTAPSMPQFTATPTFTPTNTLTATPTRTFTHLLTDTYTPTSSSTNTPVATWTNTFTPSITQTSSPTGSSTVLPNGTPTNTATCTMTNTFTCTNSPTGTPTLTGTPTSTATNTPTPSASPTGTWYSATPTNTFTTTLTLTNTATPNSTATFAAIATATSCLGGPVMGDNVMTGFYLGNGNGYVWLNLFAPSTITTLVSLTANMQAGSIYNLVVFADNGMGTSPTTLMAQTGPQTVASSGWVTNTLYPPVAASSVSNYWMGVVTSPGGGIGYYGACCKPFESMPWSSVTTPPAAFSPTPQTGDSLNIYANGCPYVTLTYTPTPTWTLIPTPTYSPTVTPTPTDSPAGTLIPTATITNTATPTPTAT